MEILRTPDSHFKDIKDYPYNPIYTSIVSKDGTEVRVHHIDEGPKDGPILLAMHGQPVWSYLYAKMIPILNEAGIRVIAPDLIGYGKSDKPTEWRIGLRTSSERAHRAAQGSGDRDHRQSLSDTHHLYARRRAACCDDESKWRLCGSCQRRLHRLHNKGRQQTWV